MTAAAARSLEQNAASPPAAPHTNLAPGCPNSPPLDLLARPLAPTSPLLASPDLAHDDRRHSRGRVLLDCCLAPRRPSGAREPRVGGNIDVYLNITNLGTTESLDLSAVTLLIEYAYTVWWGRKQNDRHVLRQTVIYQTIVSRV